MTGLPRARRAAAGPARRRADRPPRRQPGRDRQERRAAYATACVHHRRPGRRRALARRAGSRFPRRPTDNHEIRPGQGIAGPARHLHRRRLHRRRRPVGRRPVRTAPPGRPQPARRTARKVDEHHAGQSCHRTCAAECTRAADLRGPCSKAGPALTVQNRTFCRVNSSCARSRSPFLGRRRLDLRSQPCTPCGGSG